MRVDWRCCWVVLAFGVMALAGRAAVAAPGDATAGGRSAHPNVIYMLCDDLGYGDVHAFNPQRGKIPTPNMDRFTAQGMAFTDAHSSSSVCTPSRYAILTGRYDWRSTLQAGVLSGTSPALLEPGRLTIASMLQAQGYDTICIGKWHEGFTFGPHRFTDAIVDGPLQHGFDHFFGIAASLDMPPFAYINDDRFPENPTTTKKWVRSGPAAPSFEAVNVLPTLVDHAVAFLHDHRADGGQQAKPFFLYFALTSPHTPLVPTPQFAGKSPLGKYGDFVMETDWAIGQVLDAVDADHLDSNTIVVFTSDNGCAPYIGVKDLEAKGHFPSAEFRGYKSDIWDGGHRIPFVVRWPGVVAPGSRADQTICLSDWMATLAQFFGVTLPPNAGEDSVSILNILRGTEHGPIREAEVHHSIYGNFAIRMGKWKLELCAGSGGWTAPREAAAHKEGLPNVQLYDMDADIGEQHNVQAEHPDVVAQLMKLLQKYVDDGRSTPGPRQKNDVPIDLWKLPDPSKVTTKPAEGND